jgi:hypothetical protein
MGAGLYARFGERQLNAALSLRSGTTGAPD